MVGRQGFEPRFYPVDLYNNFNIIDNSYQRNFQQKIWVLRLHSRYYRLIVLQVVLDRRIPQNS